MPTSRVFHVDVAVVGAGIAGLAAFRAARRSGLRAVLVGKPPFGTTCARVGCMPSKALLSAAKKAQAAKTLQKLAGDASSLNLDTKAILQDVRIKRDHFVAAVKDGMSDFGDDEFIEGYAVFLDANRLEVRLADGECKAVAANTIIIATGSSPIILPGFDDQPGVLTTDSLFEQETLPQKPIIIGDGAIALECAFALSQLGNDVTLLGHGGPIGGLSDEDIDQVAREALLGGMTYVPD